MGRVKFARFGASRMGLNYGKLFRFYESEKRFLDGPSPGIFAPMKTAGQFWGAAGYGEGYA